MGTIDDADQAIIALRDLLHAAGLPADEVPEELIAFGVELAAGFADSPQQTHEVGSLVVWALYGVDSGRFIWFAIDPDRHESHLWADGTFHLAPHDRATHTHPGEFASPLAVAAAVVAARWREANE